MKFILSLLFLSALNGAVGDSGLRGLQTNGFDENVGQCLGARCGMWGDPHIVTCDNLGYDCQGIGIFTLMKNHMWDIQANFVDVGAIEHGMVAGWGLTMGASLTNDVAIDYVYDDSVPTFQFGFGDLTAYEEPVLWAEKDCLQWKTFDPVDMPGQGRSVEDNVVGCRERCEETEGCIAFHFWQDGGCHLNDGNQAMTDSNPAWSRAVIGYIDNECGIPPPEEPVSPHPDEAAMHGSIGNNCPLLMWVDGELVDLSGDNDQDYLYGEYGDKHVVIREGNFVRVRNELENGEMAEVELVAKGDGVGRLWSCHWDFYICLPVSQQSQFEQYSVGLLGTPDGNTSNDWMDTDGNTLPIQNNHVESFNYCVDNWCVSQEESFMSFDEDNTYNDYKCETEEYVDYTEDKQHCVLNAEKIEEKCGDMPPLMIHACQVECCFGGCADIAETIEEVVDIVRLDENPDADVIYDIPDFSDCEKDGSFKSTSDTACGDSATPVVTLLGSNGNVPLPEGVDVFYGIVTDMEPHDDVSGTTVKFKVNNPFDSNADVYVKHEKSVAGNFNDPHCVEFDDTAGGCADSAEEIEVACRHYDGVAPFAVVQVYFASSGLATDSSVDVDQCCEAPEYASDIGVVEYTFEIKCNCPAVGAAIA